MKNWYPLLFTFMLISCSATRVYIVDHRVVKKSNYYNFTGKPDTIRMITLETGEVITHEELDRRFNRAIKEMRKVKRVQVNH